MTLEDLRKYETDFTAVTGKFKDLDAPGEDLEALRKKSATYSRAYHNFWTAVLAGLGGLTFAIVWGAASGGGPAGAALVSVFGIIALTGGLATAASADEYFRLRTDVPKIEERLNQAFHKKVYFADESPPPKEVPEKATPER
ncbi:MAG TPA: hypothetical protein VFF67_10425 [Thermoplasmata archaeon]|nr:hypothetical protein [Thermoplasmata archaeon]